MKPWRVWITNKILRHLFCAFSANDVIHIRWVDEQKKIASIFIGNQKLHTPEALNLVKELRLFKELPSFQKTLNSMKGMSNEMIFTKSKTTDDLVFSKAMLYTIDVLERLILSISTIEEIR